MIDPAVLSALLTRLGQGDPEAWPDFLREFAPVLLQVAQQIERDADAAGDTFLFICERLAAQRGRRLRQFDPAGPGRFLTWLRAVAWNLALDAKRHRRGRYRPLAAIRRLPLLQQRLFRLRYEQGLTFDQAYATLRPEFPGMSKADAASADADVDRAVDSRQRWLIATRHPIFEAIDALPEDQAPDARDPVDPAADPEERAIARDQQSRLSRVLAALDPTDRLMLQLRFEEGLTLAEVARMCGLKDLWAADRRLRDLLKRLRAQLAATRPDGSV